MNNQTTLIFAALAVIALLFSPMVGACADAKEIEVVTHRWFQSLNPGTTEFTMGVQVTNPEEGDIVVITAMTDKEWDMGNINAWPDEQQLWTVGSSEIKLEQIGQYGSPYLPVPKITVFVQINIGSCPDTAEICGDPRSGAELFRFTAMVVSESTAKKIEANKYNTETTLRKLGALRVSREVCLKRPCGEAEQVVEVEEPEVWIPSPRQGENIGRDTTEIDVFWKSKGTEYYTIIGLGSTNQPWDWPKGIVYNMDCDDGSKFSGKMTFFVGSCKDTEDGNGKGANKEYIEIIAVKDEDVEKVENLGCSFEREKVKPFIRASYAIWVDRPCGCCGQIQ